MAAAAADEQAVMTAAAYSEAVRQWLQQAHQWQLFAAGFPSYLAYQASLQQQQQRPQQDQENNRHPFQRISAPRFREPEHERNAGVEIWLEVKVAPLWKRFMAEAIDFMSLFVLKLLITFIAVDTFELIDFDSFVAKYDSSLASMVNFEELELANALEITSDIVLLEIVHRVFVCFFETICLFRGPLGTFGGATPGKLMMGIRVFRCDEVAPGEEPDMVRFRPATDLGLFLALLRSILKNMSMALLFPVSLTFLFLPYNRTLYDVLSRSIVVAAETEQLPRRR